jgi:hypothetical protein
MPMDLLAFAAARTRACCGLVALWIAAAQLAAPAAAQSAGDALDLRFASFFRQPVGPQGLQLGEGLLAAQGRRVRLVGYMVAQEHPAAGRFLLTPRPVRMSEHADGAADDLPPSTVTVLLDEQQRERVIAYQPGLIALTGRLEVGRGEDAAGRVSWVRLHLEPQAVAADQLAEPAVHTKPH